MTYEYKCNAGHCFEQFFTSFRAAEPYVDNYPFCPVCTELHYASSEPAKRVVSMPLQPHLYGDPVGYHKPSPTKRYSTKTVSKKEGNSSAIG